MIEHMDNFSIYGTTLALMTDGIYAQANGSMSLQNDPDGISSGRVIRQTSSAASQALLRYVYSSPQAVCGQAIRVFMNNLPTGAQDRPRVNSWRNGSNVEQAYLIIETTGALTFTDTPGGGTTTITTTGPVITASGWWHIEVKYDTSGVGSIEVRVEGLTVLQNANLGYVAKPPISQQALHFFGNNFSSTAAYWKDLVIWNGGGTYNNNFLGSVLVHNLVPTADVALNWTPTPAGAGYTILDNIPPNDAQFITAPNPPPAAYVCSLSDLPLDVTSVKGIMSFVRAAKTDGGDGSLQNSVVSNGDTANGANRPITVAQTYWRDLFEADPDTAAPWTPAAVNAVQLQINRTL